MESSYYSYRHYPPIYPKTRVIYGGGEKVGDTFENVIRHRIPPFDFGLGEVAMLYRKNPSYIRRDLREVYRIQEHFKSVLTAAGKYDKEGDYEKACYHYEQLLFEKYYDPEPIDRLIQIYGEAKLHKTQKEVLIEAIEQFKALRKSRGQYLEMLSMKSGLRNHAQQLIREATLVKYYDNAFELYNPFTIIDKWEKQLKGMANVITKDMYKQDVNLCTHEEEETSSNTNNIYVIVTRRTEVGSLIGTGGFDVNLCINPSEKTYHATLEREDEAGEKLVQEIKLPTEAIQEFVNLTYDKKFMSLESTDIFPDAFMMDGNEVTFTVRTASDRVTLESNLLDETLSTGIISTRDEEVHTPFHYLGSIAFETLGIEPEDYNEY